MSGDSVPAELPRQAVEPWWRDVWSSYGARYLAEIASEPLGEDGLRRELIFCLLGGHGVSFELASSATEVVADLDPFGPQWTPARLRDVLREQLARPRFAPRRSDGSLRRFRYPRRKAELLALAAEWLRAQGSIRDALEARHSEFERRAWLCACPGLGLKSSSWLLRNSGWARQLAILDVHLLRAMGEVGLIEEVRLPRDYEAVERRYLRWAAELQACPAALDLFLWDVQRSRGRSRSLTRGDCVDTSPGGLSQ